MLAPYMPGPGVAPDVRETIALLIESIRGNASNRIACQRAGIDPSQLANWLRMGKQGIEPYATLSRAVEQARGTAAMALLSRMTRLSGQGDYRATAWLLERVHGLADPAKMAAVEAMERATVVADERPVPKGLSRLSPEEREERLERLRAAAYGEAPPTRGGPDDVIDADTGETSGRPDPLAYMDPSEVPWVNPRDLRESDNGYDDELPDPW